MNLYDTLSSGTIRNSINMRSRESIIRGKGTIIRDKGTIMNSSPINKSLGGHRSMRVQVR